MFEGFVSQILLGYLGRYVKGIQKDQLKIGLWREEILLEKVELILEAFDYLQLPFALKIGQVGKLSIKIPWKKLGWEPIIVALEDVFICACQREENEWSSDSVEKRELGGKLAKLNAIELAKFSRRVSDNPAGRSFLSYIYAKILDNIQVSIKNVHIVYIDSHNNKGSFLLGLRFSALTIMTDTQKQNAITSTSARSRSSQVNKIVEISNIGLYCNLLEVNLSPLCTDGNTGSQLCCDIKIDSERQDYLLNPFDVSISLLVNKSGKLDGAPQYAIIAELTALVMSVNEIQLHQILSLCDYFTICSLRERYGRYRPSPNSLSQKLNGWQRMWWQYALESVLLDVRRKLRKTSWSTLGRRISQCRRYVNLYKRKLELLQQEQTSQTNLSFVNKEILTELEKMDKEYDIDDILNFRCVAEQELQDLLNSRPPNTETRDFMQTKEKQQNSDQLESRARGWLNWLSLGMLGAGGTADSSSFAGAVSDEIIKDIYDATEFHPVPSSGGDSSIRDKSCLFSIKLNICQIISTISAGRLKKKIANAIFDGINVESEVWEDSIAVHALVGSVKIISPCDDIVMLMAKKAMLEESSPLQLAPFIDIHVHMLQPNLNSEVLVKVAFQPFEVIYESNFFLDLIHFCDVLSSFQFQSDRVLHSLNGLRSFKARMISKTEYISSNRKKIKFDVSLQNAIMKLPLKSEVLDCPIMALELEGLSLKSGSKLENSGHVLGNGHGGDHAYEAWLKDPTNVVPQDLHFEDLYDHYDIELSGFEVYLSNGNVPGATSVIEKMNAFIQCGLCIFFDEPVLDALEVDCLLPSVEGHFSPIILHALVAVCDKLLKQKSEATAGNVSSVSEIGEHDDLHSFQIFLSIRVDQLNLSISLEEDALNSSVFCIIFSTMNFSLTIQECPECYFYIKNVRAEELNPKDESYSCVLCLSRNDSGSSTPYVQAEGLGINSPSVLCTEDSKDEGCFKFKYHSERDGCIVQHECYFYLNDVDFHIYPRIFRLLGGLIDSLSKESFSLANSFEHNQQSEYAKAVGVEFSEFVSSNFNDIETSTSASTGVDNFPFVAISNSDTLSSLKPSLISDVTGLRHSYGSDKYHRIQSFKFRKKPRTMSSVTAESPFNMERADGPNHLNTINVYLLHFYLDNLRCHFHDSSCILGTIALSKSRSSLSSQENACWDAQICTEGLILSSSWSSPNIHEQLWGPTSSGNAPILNIRLRKKKTGALVSVTEISFGIQHVCCILPSSFLAVVIGYFSLPDWTSTGSGNVDEQCTTENREFGNLESMHSDFLYKFEILHSRLIFPVESLANFCLQLGLSQLYVSFIPMSCAADGNKDIPSCCVLAANLTSDKVDIINVFGRTTSLSLIPLRDDVDFLLKPNEHHLIANIPLIEQLDMDMWIRVPCINKACVERAVMPTLIMVKAYVCNLVAEDKYLFVGIQAIGSVVDELSFVAEDSKLFSSDVLHFLHIRKSLKEANTASLVNSNNDFISMKLCAKEISVKFSRWWIEQPSSLETVAKADLQLSFSASIEKGALTFLDIDMPSVVIQSYASNIPLASFVSDSSMGSHLCIKFCQSVAGERQLLLAIPSLDVWLHLSDWSNFIDVVESYTYKYDGASFSSDAGPEIMHNDAPESCMSIYSGSEYVMEEDVILIIKSEISAIAIHLPILDKEQNLVHFEMDEPPRAWKYIKFVLQSRCWEFTVGKNHSKFKGNIEKLKANLEMVRGQNNTSIPFIQINQIKLDSLMQKREGLIHIVIEVQIESLDIGLSYQIFNFWSSSQLKLPDGSSSPFPFHCMVSHVHLRKGSVLLSDGRWSYHGPIFEILTKNMLVEFKETQDTFEASVNADIIINYNNINKVMWEPFVEPCHLQLNLLRKIAGTVLMNSSASTYIYLESSEDLNLNITEPLVEAIFRVKQLIDDALNQAEEGGLPQSQGILGFHCNNDVQTRRYAPYILQNDTSLPLTFQVSRGSFSTDDICGLSNHENIVHPGHAVPIFVEESVDEQYFRHRTAYSSERLIEKRINSFPHHMISIYLEGTTGPSKPMSMDLVGLSYFEVNFSNNKQSELLETEREDEASGFNRMMERHRSDQNKGLVVPVVFEVSMQHYSKMIRLYSTVILFNATSMPLQLRFDIPFGVSPKVLDPILPGQEIPLPLHLAESGRIRWRPLGNNYLWSEAQSLSNILSQEYRLGFLRSFVCYPSQPSSDPFRCCISIQDYSLSASSGTRNHSSLYSHVIRKAAINGVNERLHEPDLPKKHIIRQVRLTTPFVVKNYLPIDLSLAIESGGVSHSISIKQVDIASISHIDSTNDLGITIHMQGYRPIVGRFPRAELFSSMAKLNGSKYHLSETLSVYPETSSGPTRVTLEKAMDASCGAREICLYISFLLYNCTGLVLGIVDANSESKGSAQLIPSSYHLIGQESLSSGKQGVPLLCSELESCTRTFDGNSHTVSIREKSSLYLHRLSNRHFPFPLNCRHFSDNTACHDLDARGAFASGFINDGPGNKSLPLSVNKENGNSCIRNEPCEGVKPFMYCSLDDIPSSEPMVKLCAHLPQSISGSTLPPTWSAPISLIPASGSTNICIPKPSGFGAFLISASLIPVSGDLSGRTKAITFQPRYVICNACSRDLCYKQKGTNDFYRLGVGQHSHLHLSDTSRELYVSIRFIEPGSQWSGSFLPDCLGDVQVKMRNYVSGALHMVRVEVQNADLAINVQKMAKNANASSSTQLILLSDDKSGFMPYRIDNFSMERLRVYQQKCEPFETIVHAYSSSQYAWDEPCYPHRLVVEVPGERILGTYTLDSIQECLPVYLPLTSEKAERRLLVSVHAEGAIKVLSIIDSTHHIMEDMKETSLLGFKEKRKADKKHGTPADFNEVVTLHLPYIGISLVNSSPQEIVFACARETTITVMQSLDQQKMSFQILDLQIDNQLLDTPYPIILSFNNEHRGRSTNFLTNKQRALRIQSDNGSPSTCESTNESVFYFAAAKWRNADSSLVSFKYINLRLDPLCIELEEQVLICLLDFSRTVSSRLQSRNLQKHFELRSLEYGIGISGQLHANGQGHKHIRHNLSGGYKTTDIDTNSQLLPTVIPIGTPWQQICLSARKKKKIYVEVFELAPITLSLSFASTPWVVRNEANAGIEHLVHISSTTFQRGLMALVEVEGVPVHLGELILGHLMASRESVIDIITKHYTRQLLHEMYKVFGSAGVIGNPIGFARNVGLGIKDFLSLSSREIVQSPTGILNGIAQGSRSLLSNTVYAISSATTQFTKTAHKGIVAFTFDEQADADMNVQLKGLESHGKGILSEFLEGLTGLLQSPIRGAEKHGLPGVVSGIAMGTAGLVARPMASILEATGKTAQSIRKRSSPHQSNRLRIRFPRPLARELPLLPYSWEEAIGVSMLLQAGRSRLRDETLVMCKSLKQSGKFVVISERLVLSVRCSCLADLGSPDFAGVPADPDWVIETEMSLESIVHVDRTDDVVNIVGSNAESSASTSRQKKGFVKDGNRSWKTTPTCVPFFYMRVECRDREDAEDVLQVLLSTVDQGKERRRGKHVLHRSNLR